MRRLIVCLLVLTLSVPATACLWDYDTLQMEREPFPGALELIVGKFLRHTGEFYEWRVKDRRKDIGAHDLDIEALTDEELARAYDDLAVALDKLGRHDEAIAMIREKAERLPNVGQYETHANLGTFLAHSGRLEEGVAELKKAIEIDSGAPHGREKYQVLIVEYVMEKQRGDRRILPLDESTRSTEWLSPFVLWLLSREGLADDKGRVSNRVQAGTAVERAAGNVLRMMRFDDYRSPVLLEVLGDLIVAGRNLRAEKHGERLAARAYLRAADGAEAVDVKEKYRKLAADALVTPNPAANQQYYENESELGISLRQLEDQLAREVQETDAWFAKTIADDEELWIFASPDPDAAFWKKYGGHEVRVGYDRLPTARFALKGLPLAAKIALGVAFVVTFGTVAALIAWRRQRPTGYDSEPTQTV